MIHAGYSMETNSIHLKHIKSFSYLKKTLVVSDIVFTWNLCLDDAAQESLKLFVSFPSRYLGVPLLILWENSIPVLWAKTSSGILPSQHDQFVSCTVSNW